MTHMRYDKLVRDHIPDIIRADGREPVVHIADQAEYWTKLKEKLREETEEFLQEESINEIADILEVIDAIAAVRGIAPEEIARVKAQKATSRGGFAKRIILEES